MIERRSLASLGGADHGWLQAKHHFSFAQYYDEQRIHWGALRVWNDDTIQPNTGFPMHPHQNMEIITYVREGAISHEDSLGNQGRTLAGDVQVMSAGTGIRHSEYNLEPIATRIFQIWLYPNEEGHEPSWGTRPFPQENRSGQFIVLASGFAEDTDALKIHSDARVLGAKLSAGEEIQYSFQHAERFGYLVPAFGSVEINGVFIDSRDGAAIHQEQQIRIKALTDTELVLVDAGA